jgi:hypothetical protein
MRLSINMIQKEQLLISMPDKEYEEIYKMQFVKKYENAQLVVVQEMFQKYVLLMIIFYKKNLE